MNTLFLQYQIASHEEIFGLWVNLPHERMEKFVNVWSNTYDPKRGLKPKQSLLNFINNQKSDIYAFASATSLRKKFKEYYE